ncbi:MAG: UspA domain protein, partial [Polaromonas sp.]|nr:UspA domain protein [Polaromonas sp.]
MYQRILLAYDGSAPGQQALLDCHEIAQWSGSELRLIAVMPLPLNNLGLEGSIYDETLQESEK